MCFLIYNALKTKRKYIHRGEILQYAVQQNELSITQIAKKAGYSRASYYNHIEDPHLSYEVLQRYGKAIKYDFTTEFDEMRKYVFDGAEEYRLPPKTFEEALEERDYWRNKYLHLLERHNQLIEEKLQNKD